MSIRCSTSPKTRVSMQLNQSNQFVHSGLGGRGLGWDWWVHLLFRVPRTGRVPPGGLVSIGSSRQQERSRCYFLLYSTTFVLGILLARLTTPIPSWKQLLLLTSLGGYSYTSSLGRYSYASSPSENHDYSSLDGTNYSSTK